VSLYRAIRCDAVSTVGSYLRGRGATPGISSPLDDALLSVLPSGLQRIGGFRCPPVVPCPFLTAPFFFLPAPFLGSALEMVARNSSGVTLV
jgi:hypothetical protein